MNRPKDRQNVINISYDMGGKMENVLSVSSSCKNNPLCLARHGEGMTKAEFMRQIRDGGHPCICMVCFAIRALAYKTNLQNNLNENADILANRLLGTEELFTLAMELVEASEINNSPMLRLESFGDIATVTQALNYINLCWLVGMFSQEKIHIAWWTKNWTLLLEAWRKTDEQKKSVFRRCTNIVLSSSRVGIEVDRGIVRNVENELGMPVKVFTVDGFESERTNCGARSCFKCHRCYDKTESTEYIYEVVK